MLQLVGRHEMEKVTLQRESDSNHQKLVSAMVTMHPVCSVDLL